MRYHRIGTFFWFGVAVLIALVGLAILPFRWIYSQLRGDTYGE